MKCFGNISVLLFLVILTIVRDGQGQVYLQPKATHPDHPGYCYYAGPPVTLLKIGQKKRQTDSCSLISCLEGFTIYFEGCDLHYSADHCRYIRGDLSLPWPDCCGDEVC